MNTEHNPYVPPKAEVDNQALPNAATRPRAVDIAVVLIAVNVLLGVVRVISAVNAVNEGAISGLTFLGQIVEVAIWIWLCFPILRGRNWARIFALIVAILELTTLVTVTWSARQLLAGMRYAFGTERLLMSFLPSLLNIVAVYLLFVPGRAWFKRRVTAR